MSWYYMEESTMKGCAEDMGIGAGVPACRLLYLVCVIFMLFYAFCAK